MPEDYTPEIDVAFDNFLRTDPAAQRALKDAAAERRLRERDALPAHLPAEIVTADYMRWIRITDEAGNSHVEYCGE